MPREGHHQREPHHRVLILASRLSHHRRSAAQTEYSPSTGALGTIEAVPRHNRQRREPADATKTDTAQLDPA